MKNKLIASIVTLTIVGGAVTPTFAATKEFSIENANRCSISGSLLQGVTLKKIWWDNFLGETIITGGTVDKPNNENNNNSIIPPTGDTERPNVPNNPSVDEMPDNSTDSDTNFMAAIETAIYNKVNEERAKSGVSELTYNTVMQKYARIKSQDMGDNNYFSHEDLNGNFITAKMKNDGVSYKAWGENIAYVGGNVSADALADKFMTNWMNSSGHRANILSTNFSSIGVGVYKIGNKVYATQEFYR